MVELEIEHARLNDDWVCLSVKGEIDLATVEKLEDAVGYAYSEDGAHLLIDLSEIAFIDSTGLRSLLTNDRRFRDSGRSLALVVRDGPVSRLLEISGVQDSLEIVSHPGEVLDSDST